MDRIKIEEAEEFRDLISGYQNIQHMLFWRVHRPVFLTWQGITCSACWELTIRCHWLGEQVSTNDPIEPPMCAVIEFGKGEIRINLDAFLGRKSGRRLDDFQPPPLAPLCIVVRSLAASH